MISYGEKFPSVLCIIVVYVVRNVMDLLKLRGEKPILIMNTGIPSSFTDIYIYINLYEYPHIYIFTQKCIRNINIG